MSQRRPDPPARPESLTPPVLRPGPSATVLALIDEAQREERQGRRERARSAYERALHELSSDEQADTAAALLRWIGRTYQVDSRPDAALDSLEAALAISEVSGDEGGVAHAMSSQAAVHWQLGQLDDAEALWLRTRASAQRSGDAKLAAMTAQHLGALASARGELDRAMQHYELALSEYRSLGLPSDVCTTLNCLLKLYTEVHRWADAERAYEEAVQISTVLGDLQGRTMLEVNYAELGVARGAFDKAREACDRATALTRQTQDSEAIGETHKIYGVIAREASDYAAAEMHFAAGEAIAEQRRDLLLAAKLVRERAELHRRQGRNRDALQCLNRAHRLFSQLRARREVADIDRRTGRLEEDFLEVVRRWGESIESKDRHTRGHCERVADLSCALAARTGMDEQSLFWFRIGAVLHDVGKLIIPSEVLNKPGPLTPDEWALMKRHPTAGVEMLADIEFPWDVRPIVESHHERWDGAGYPHGLSGEGIPITARILCVADVYDALTSERSYKHAMSHEEAMVVMRSQVGRQFDPALFVHFEEVVRDWAATPAAAPPDELTGLPLRRAFVDTSSRLLAARGATPAALLVIDVDRFKLVNDSYGHLQGDEVLRAVARVLCEQVRPDDFVARYAGDEFVVLLPGRTAEEATAVADKLRLAVEAERVPLRGESGGALGVTLSIGAAEAPRHGSTLEALFAAADRALYEVKRRGRNSVALAANDGVALRAPRLGFEHFVGREAELRKLVTLLDESAAGAARAVAVVGEAGVGKSTLVRQLGPEVRLRGGELVSGRCHEADVRDPYGPWAEALEAAYKLTPAASGRVWRELPRLIPALGTTQLAPESAGSKFALLDEIADLLRLAAAARPIVVVLDDMQWADAPSWDALEHLLSRAAGERLLVCLTVRAEDSSGPGAARRAWLARDGRYQEVLLPRLSPDETSQWVAAAFHRQDVAPDFLRFLYRHTEGNPLFIVQVLRTLVDEGAVWYANGRWEWRAVDELRIPVAVNDLISRRLERLSPEARTMLTTAAVIGREFDVELAVASGVGSLEELREAIDEGIAAAVLEPSPAQPETHFRFTHALLVEVIRRGANARRLKRAHERVARALEPRGAVAAAQIAAHFDAAGIAPKAYEYGLMAAENAAAVYAHQEASDFFALAERHAATPDEAGEARVRHARVAEAAGRHAEAEQLYERTLEWITGTGDRARDLEVRRALARLRSLQGQPPQESLQRCLTLLAEAEAAGADGERVALLTMISQVYSRLGDVDSAERIARDCVRMADDARDPWLLADALTRLGTTLLDERPDEALESYERALALFTELGECYGQLRCRTNIGNIHMRIGNAAEAERANVLALELGRRVQASDLAGVASLNLGVLYMRAGDFEQARERFEEAQRLFAAVGNEANRLIALYNMANLARERGNATEALALYDATATVARALAQADVEIGARAGAGLACLRLGRHDAAADALEHVSRLIAGRGDWWFQGREIADALAVRHPLAAGDAAVGSARFHEALRLAERYDEYGAAWLLAECAESLDAAGVEIWSTVDRYAPRIEAMGYAPLVARYEALMALGRS